MEYFCGLAISNVTYIESNNKYNKTKVKYSIVGQVCRSKLYRNFWNDESFYPNNVARERNFSLARKRNLDKPRIAIDVIEHVVLQAMLSGVYTSVRTELHDINGAVSYAKRDTTCFQRCINVDHNYQKIKHLLSLRIKEGQSYAKFIDLCPNLRGKIILFQQNFNFARFLKIK